MRLCSPDKCTGCMACRESCPVDAIETCINNEGFQEPRIVESKCLSCGKCTAVCPVLNPPSKNDFIPVGYSGWARDDEIRMSSSSGGIFSVLAEKVLKAGGVVFGVAFDENFVARNIYVEKLDDLPKLRGSKYVQADVGSVYKRVKGFLRCGRRVLFSGTPCQNAALINYLGERDKNLVLIDFVCHGVPSPRIFEEYKFWLKRHYGFAKFYSIHFRDKYFAWNLTSQRVCGSDSTGKRIDYLKSSLFDVYRLFFDTHDLIERLSCYQCPFAEERRNSDITIADWWGGYKTRGLPEEVGFLKKGVSLVLINSISGSKLLESVNSELFLLPRSLQEVYGTNRCFHESYPMPENRKTFWDYYREHGFEKTVEKFAIPRKFPLYIRLRVNMRVNVATNLICKSLELGYRMGGKLLRMVGMK